MPRGTASKICKTCEKSKGVRAFRKGSEVCRGCEAGVKPKSAKPRRSAPKKTARPATPRRRKLNDKHKTLRTIVARHTRPNGAGRYQAFIDQLVIERDQINRAIATFEALG